MRFVDRLLLLLAATGAWAFAGLFYLQYFHEGGRAKPPEAPRVTVAFPERIQVENAPGTVLKVAGEAAAQPAAAPAALKLVCTFSGKIVTMKPGIFGSSRWDPEREWPLTATFECKPQ
jgi:hypothetical protein